MEENMLPVPDGRHRRRQKQRRRRFPWGSIVTVILVVAVCGYAFTLFGDEGAPENPQANDTTTTLVPGTGLLDESTPQNTQAADDDTDWNLMLVNYENAIPENYEPKLVEVPGGEKVDERIYDPLMELLEAAKEGNWDQLPMVVSGYRTQKKQQLFDDKVAGYRKEGNSQSEAEELAKQWVSVPGYSEHQIGLAVDINGATYGTLLYITAHLPSKQPASPAGNRPGRSSGTPHSLGEQPGKNTPRSLRGRRCCPSPAWYQSIWTSLPALPACIPVPHTLSPSESPAVHFSSDDSHNLSPKTAVRRLVQVAVRLPAG